MENEIYITDENGQERKMNILLTYEVKGKEFVLVHEENDEENVYAFSYDESGNLFPVEDPSEENVAREVLYAFQNEGEEDA